MNVGASEIMAVCGLLVSLVIALFQALGRETIGELRRRITEAEKAQTATQSEVSEARRILATHSTELVHVGDKLDNIDKKIDRLLERGVGRGSIHEP